jgi:hypothetical protein
MPLEVGGALAAGYNSIKKILFLSQFFQAFSVHHSN